MKRRGFITLVGSAAFLAVLSWRLTTYAQEMPLVGFLSYGTAATSTHTMAGLRKGLSEGGYVEHRNVKIEPRWGDTRIDQLPEHAAELVRLKVSVIVASPGASAGAAKAATSDIPIVFGVGNDPVTSGLVASLNRPGGNATGVFFFTTELAAKRLGMLRELVPAARRLAVLINRAPQNRGLTKAADIATREAQTAAAALGLTLDIVYVESPLDIDAAFANFAQKRPDALMVSPSPLFGSRRVQLITLATRERLPTIYPSRDYAEAGGLMTYGAGLAIEFRTMGNYAARILKGAKPADLPVEQSTKFEFILNLQTARALGLDVPATLLARADEVIE
jgi:putative ABC transport system substrate-binding protein